RGTAHTPRRQRAARLLRGVPSRSARVLAPHGVLVYPYAPPRCVPREMRWPFTEIRQCSLQRYRLLFVYFLHCPQERSYAPFGVSIVATSPTPGPRATIKSNPKRKRTFLNRSASGCMACSAFNVQPCGAVSAGWAVVLQLMK